MFSGKMLQNKCKRYLYLFYFILVALFSFKKAYATNTSVDLVDLPEELLRDHLFSHWSLEETKLALQASLGNVRLQALLAESFAQKALTSLSDQGQQWQQKETQRAVDAKQEPLYIHEIAFLLQQKIAYFSQKKIGDCRRKEELSRHAYSLSLAVAASFSRLARVYGLSEVSLACFVTFYAPAQAEHAKVDAISRKAALQLLENAAWNKAKEQLKKAARQLKVSAAWTAAQEASNAVSLASRQERSKQAISLALESQDLRLFEAENWGRLAYRVNEKVVLLAVLLELDKLLEVTYQAASTQLSAEPVAAKALASLADWRKLDSLLHSRSSEEQALLLPLRAALKHTAYRYFRSL